MLGDAPGDADRVEARFAAGVDVGGGVSHHCSMLAVAMPELRDRGDDAFRVRLRFGDIIPGDKHVDEMADAELAEADLRGNAALAGHHADSDALSLAVIQQLVHALVQMDMLVVIPLVQLDVFGEGDVTFGGIDVVAEDYLVGRPEMGADLGVRQAAPDARFEHRIEGLVDQRQGVGDGSVEIEDDRGESRHGATLSSIGDRSLRT